MSLMNAAQTLSCTCAYGQKIRHLCLKINCSKKRVFCDQCQVDHQDHQSQIINVGRRNNNGLQIFSYNDKSAKNQTFQQKLRATQDIIQRDIKKSSEDIQANVKNFPKQLIENTVGIIQLLIQTTDSKTKDQKRSQILNKNTKSQRREQIVKQYNLLKYKKTPYDKNYKFRNSDQVMKLCDLLCDKLREKLQWVNLEIKSLLIQVKNQLSQIMNPLYQKKQSQNTRNTNIRFKSSLEKQIQNLKESKSNLESIKRSRILTQYKNSQLKEQNFQLQKRILLNRKGLPQNWVREKSVVKIRDQFREKFPQILILVSEQPPSNYHLYGKTILNYQGLFLYKFAKRGLKGISNQKVKEICELQVLRSRNNNIRQRISQLQQRLQPLFPSHNVNVFTTPIPSAWGGHLGSCYFTKQQCGVDICIILS